MSEKSSNFERLHQPGCLPGVVRRATELVIDVFSGRHHTDRIINEQIETEISHGSEVLRLAQQVGTEEAQLLQSTHIAKILAASLARSLRDKNAMPGDQFLLLKRVLYEDLPEHIGLTDLGLPDEDIETIEKYL